MSLQKLKQHEFIDLYLKYTDKTESPKIMHLWSALASSSACIARHAYLQTGIGKIYPNIFTLLVGPPGTRKSQAMKYSAKLVRKYTNVRFAPDDTGSQRQGLLMALVGEDSDRVNSKQLEGKLEIANRNLDATDIDSLKDIQIQLSTVDQYCLFAAASEFTTFMGNGDAITASLLNKVWDGESYDYRLKAERHTLKDSLMTIVGCTTQSEIARVLPSESIGQGFMSRWILVFAPKRDKRVHIDEAGCDKKLEPLVANVFKFLFNDLRGDISFTKTANNLQRDIYMEDKVQIADSRFIYYLERRHTHLLKLCMLLAATRHSSKIETIDIEMANMLLSMTESGMPDALGEFGLSPLSGAKQKLLEFLRSSNEAVSLNVLWTIMSNDMKSSDFKLTLKELTNKNKIQQIQIDVGTAYVYKDDLSSVWEDMVEVKPAISAIPTMPVEAI